MDKEEEAAWKGGCRWRGLRGSPEVVWTGGGGEPRSCVNWQVGAQKLCERGRGSPEAVWTGRWEPRSCLNGEVGAQELFERGGGSPEAVWTGRWEPRSCVNWQVGAQKLFERGGGSPEAVWTGRWESRSCVNGEVGAQKLCERGGGAGLSWSELDDVLLQLFPSVGGVVGGVLRIILMMIGTSTTDHHRSDSGDAEGESSLDGSSPKLRLCGHLEARLRCRVDHLQTPVPLPELLTPVDIRHSLRRTGTPMHSWFPWNKNQQLNLLQNRSKVLSSVCTLWTSYAAVTDSNYKIWLFWLQTIRFKQWPSLATQGCNSTKTRVGPMPTSDHLL